MNLKKVKIIDNNFAHAKFTTDYQTSKHIDWVRGISNVNVSTNEIVFFTDGLLSAHESFNCKKVGLLMEPKAINSRIYDLAKKYKDNFETILTYDKELLSSSEK
jgi:hypothetical protein